MPIPDYKAIMLPLLKFAGDKQEHPRGETIEKLATLFGLSEEEKTEPLPSRPHSLFGNRVDWARISKEGGSA
jgi:restriction system protein